MTPAQHAREGMVHDLLKRPVDIDHEPTLIRVQQFELLELGSDQSGPRASDQLTAQDRVPVDVLVQQVTEAPRAPRVACLRAECP